MHTFREAVRLNSRFPQSTEEAQYSLPFPLAAALVRGQLGASELGAEALTDVRIMQISESIELIENDQFSSRFPARRIARIIIYTRDGERYDSGEVEARWNADNPPSDQELRDKFRWLVDSVLPDKRAVELEKAIWRCQDLPDAASLLDLLLPSPQ